MHEHQVQFYDSEAFLLRKILEFIEPAREAGEGSVVIATSAHLQALQATLGAPCNAARHDGIDRCLLLDAHETLATFMVDGQPDEQRFTTVIGGLLHQISDAGARPVRAFGEMVAVLYAQGNPEAALRLEHLWEGLATRGHLSLLCAYPMSAFPDETHRRTFECICDAHASVGLIELAQAADADVDQLHRAIARMQQGASALEHEAQRRREADLVVGTQRERIRAMERVLLELETLAGHDDLTGLPNRRLFTDRLAHAVEHAARAASALALLYIDLDGFKAVNDQHGHLAGDGVLKALASRLQACVRSADTLCRLGGDEFVVLMEQTDAAQAAELLSRLHTALAMPYPIAEALVPVQASIGVAHYPGDAEDAQALVRAADRAMYRQKALRKSGASSPHRTGQTLAPTSLLTVEAAAMQLRLSRPHVLKLIADRRFLHVVHRNGGLPLIPASEVTRVARETGVCDPV